MKFPGLSLIFSFLALVFLSAAYFTGVKQGIDVRINHGAVHDIWAMGIAISDGVYDLGQGYIGQPEVLQILSEVLTPEGLLGTGEQNLAMTQDRNAINGAIKMATQLDKSSLTPYPGSYVRPFFVNWGEDSGQADWYQLAFNLFGYQGSAMYALYFALLATSISIFFLQYRNNPCAIGLMAALAGTFWLLFYLDTFAVYSVPSVNSNRFLETLTVVPALHLLLMLRRHVRPSGPMLAGVALQALLMAFAISARKSGQWSVMLVWAFVIVQMLIYIWQTKPWIGSWRLAFDENRNFAKLVLVFFLCTSGYNFVRMQMHNEIYFTDCLQPYRFTWHSAFLGFNTHPLWNDFAPDYLKDIKGDGIGWTAAEHRYRQVTPCWEYICQNTGFYPSGMHDKLMRKEFFAFARHHPRFLAELYLWYKPKKMFERLESTYSIIPSIAWSSLLVVAAFGFFIGKRLKKDAFRQWWGATWPLGAVTLMTTAPHMFAYPNYVQCTSWVLMAFGVMLIAGAGIYAGARIPR